MLWCYGSSLKWGTSPLEDPGKGSIATSHSRWPPHTDGCQRYHTKLDLAGRPEEPKYTGNQRQKPKTLCVFCLHPTLVPRFLPDDHQEKNQYSSSIKEKEKYTVKGSRTRCDSASSGLK